MSIDRDTYERATEVLNRAKKAALAGDQEMALACAIDALQAILYYFRDNLE